MVKIYEKKSDSPNDDKLVPFDGIPESSGRFNLPIRKTNTYVMKENTFAVIQFPLTKPASLFAAGLFTCSAVIYIYPEESNKAKIDKIVLLHAFSSVILDEFLPASDQFNEKKCNPKDIQVIIGSPNSYDEGMQETVKRLIDHGIDSNNLSLYLARRTCYTFGIDSYGHVGEMGSVFKSFANKGLVKVFIQLMNEALTKYINQSYFPPPTIASGFGIFKGSPAVRGAAHMKQFIKIVENIDKSENVSDRIMDFLKNSKGLMKPHSLKVVFIQHVNEILFKPNNIQLSNEAIADPPKYMKELSNCLKQYEKLFHKKADANEINFDQPLESTQRGMARSVK